METGKLFRHHVGGAMFAALSLATVAPATAAEGLPGASRFDGQWHFSLTPYAWLPTFYTTASFDGPQQVTGTLGSPSATTTISGKQLPAPEPAFGGVIKDDALQSKPWWAPRIVPPKGAPNVLLIITDDAGFGVPSTFGGVIPTPTMDRIANEGCATTACSPPRCARRRAPR
jgi:hypothetical protein